MKDALGNTLAEGQLVLWNGMVARVKEVSDGGLTVMRKGGNSTTENKIVLELKLMNPPPNAVIRIVDPEAESMVEKALAGGS